MINDCGFTPIRFSSVVHIIMQKRSFRGAIRCNGLREKSALRRETQQSVHVTLVRFRGEKNRQSSTAAFALTVARYVLISLLLLFLSWNSLHRSNLEEGLFESSAVVCFPFFLCTMREYI